MKIEDKTASGKIYKDKAYWVLISSSHCVFATYRSILFVMHFPDSSLRVPLRRRPMISSRVPPPQSSQMTSDAALKLKLHRHTNHLLHLFSNLNDQSSYGPGYMWTLLALSMAVVFWQRSIPFQKWPETFSMHISTLRQQFLNDYSANLASQKHQSRTMHRNLHRRHSIISTVHTASHIFSHHPTTQNPMVKRNILWIPLNVLKSKGARPATEEI